MKIKDLLSALPEFEKLQLPLESTLLEVTDLVIDSRKASAGSLFVAMRGTKVDSHQFLNQVIGAGAVALVVEDSSQLPKDYRGVVVQVRDAREALDLLASRYFGDPSQRLFMFGVTGTNGKTSCTYLFEHIFQFCGFPTGVIGTIDHHFREQIWSAEGTTPGPLELQGRLNEMRVAGARAVAMEVTSHALAQHRADSVHFNTVLFTNLTRDHLDYHETMADYFKAKQRLFTDVLWKSAKMPQFAVVNVDDPFGRRLRVAGFAGLWTYGTRKHSDFRYQILEQDFSSSEFQLTCAFGDFRVRLSMPGAHNVANAVGVIAATATLGVPVAVAVKSLASFAGVPGRLQAVPNQKGLHVLVDYAHTPDALENALGSLSRIRDQSKSGAQLITVFGCGGNRDKGKRPQMASIAEKYSDLVVVTSDNPRTEDPMAIIHDVMEGFHKQKPWIEVDRRKAIQLAIAKARPGDVILIAGKGHENYQIIGEEKRPFHDGTVAQEFLR